MKMHLRITVKRALARKSIAFLLMPLVLLINQPVAALAAPQGPTPPNVPSYAQHPKSVRLASKTPQQVKSTPLSDHPTDIELTAARVFEEPLIPMNAPAVSGENDELAKAIGSFKSKNDPENVSAFTDFIERFPKSRWTPSVQLNVGLLRFQSGYLSQAMDLWKAAWDASRDEVDQPQKSVADRAIAEILQLNAKVGRTEEMEKILAEVKGRAFYGSMEQKIRGSSEALVQMHARPDKSYKCGPFAVSNLLAIKKGKYEFNKTIDDYPSTKEGTSLQQNKELAQKVGLELQIAKRKPGAKMVVPSVLHWKLGHYAAVVGKVGDRYEIKDPTFGAETTFLVSPEVFEDETDGYALIPAGPIPSGWQAVASEEGARVFGKGVPWLWPDNMGCPTCSSGSCPIGGMMQFDVTQTTCDLHLYDTPISYACPIGGTVPFQINYNYLQADQPASFSFTNFGYNWSFQYLSYLTVDASSTATVRLSDGHSEVYTLSGGVYTRNRLSQALLVNLGGGVYQRQLPDGSIQQFDLSDGASPAKIFMTKIFDPQNNQTTIAFDANFRITTITDPIGEVSTLTYVSNTVGNSGFYKVAQIADPFSRTASFSYDSTNTNLVATTDVIGLQSKMFYDTGNTFITSLQTPYGTSSFSQYTPYSPGNNTRGLRVNYPDGTKSVIESWIGHGQYNATFIWDRHAMELYPNDPINHDFSHANKIGWLWGPVDGYLWPIVNYRKAALENQINYRYVDETVGLDGRATIGTNTTNKPIQIFRQAATPVKASLGGTKTTGDVLTLTFTDTALPGGSQAAAYTVQASDTLTTIATGLASAVNSNANLRKLGVKAAATGTNIAMVSQSTNQTTYTKSVSGAATETISLGTPTPQSAQITLTGTVTAGNFVSLYLSDQGVSQGSAQYNIVGGDTLTTAATGLKNAINASSIYSSRGITASSFGPSIFLSTSSTPNNLQFAPYFSGAPSMSLDYQSVGNQIASYFQYNSLGHRTFSADPAGRVMSYTYAANGIDLTQITEIQNNDSFMLGNWTYNTQHRPTQYIDGSARTWGYGYNAKGQITSMTDPNSNSTSMTYTGLGSSFLTQINGPLSGTADVTNFTYDGFNRLATTTDSVGYQLAFSYDPADRRTQTLYPDGTTEKTVYDKLDAIFSKDRIGRWSQSSYDSLDQLAFEIDPLGRKTQYQWCSCGSLLKLTDPANNVTSWNHDLQGRKIQKVYADKTACNYAYESGAGRMLSRKDALNQTTDYFLNVDGTTFATGYQNAVNPTSAVINSYDSKFSRISSVQNDWGTISYTYNPYVTGPGSTPTTGGGRLATVTNNVIANSAISYSYDTLGRTTNRSINGASNSITWAYDAMSRVTSEANALGTFNYTYVDDTPGSSKGVTRLKSVGYPNSQTTNYDWYDNNGDQRLKTINNLNPTGGMLSRFDYQYNPSGEITQWQQQQNGGNDFHNFRYDNAGQLVSDQVGSGAPVAPFTKEFHYAYDLAANRKSVQQHTTDTLRLGGTVTAGNVLTVTVKDPALSGGQKAVSYTVVGGDTLATIANNLATNINLDTALQAIGVAANAQAGKTFINIRSASANLTTYTPSTSGGATATMTFGIWRNGLWNATIAGTKTTGDVLTITTKDAALAGGQQAVSYTVLVGDTLTTIATGLKNAINGNANLTALGVTATSVGTVISISSNSKNVTSYTSSTNVGATETIALAINQNGPQTATLAGTKTTGNTISVVFYDAALAGGTRTVTYTVLAGDTLTTMATNLTTAINADANLQAIGVSATSAGTVITLNSKSTNLTTYRTATSAAATATFTVSNPVSAWTVAAIGGTKTTGNVLTITFYDAGLTGGSKAVSYTVLAGDTLTTIATGLKNAINADTALQAIGVTSNSSSTIINIQSTSPNLTSYAQSVSSGATATITLSSSTSVVDSTVNNVNALVKLAPGGKTRFQGSTSKPVSSASVAGQVVTLSQKALNGVTFGSSVSGTPTETLTLGTNVDGNTTVTVGGTVTAGDVVSVVVDDPRFNYGPVVNSYTVKSGDTTSSIASALNSVIYTQMSNAGGAVYPYPYFPSVAGTVITINPNQYYADAKYSKSVTGVATETVTYSANFNGNTTATIGGTVTTGDVTSLTVYSAGLSGGSRTVSYTSAAGNTTTTIATALKNAINADTSLAAIGVTATSAAAVVTISTAGTTYTTSTSGGATVTLTQGTNANGNSTVAVGGKVTAGNTATITTFNPTLPSGQQAITYNIVASDTLVSIAAGLASAMNSNANLQTLGVTAKNSDAADLAFSQSFSGNGTLPSGASLANVSATDAVPTTKTNTNGLTVTASPSSTLTWDANGNMTSDGTNTYKWDAENRLIEIDYPGANNYSRTKMQFVLSIERNSSIYR
ncbi:MAG TPA: LysM peptidoglycan-binding domain-containing protein [Candidatus Melainabacteria bacterium]|nr:LysM peptidoglycan-binding domain-containing protein [Candidatus Melainabacteria bacterium]HIN63014.1 LysM peptidoglycan-binding domain-containing protein [Candidatus Obscuribacterales bacterium]